MCFCKYFYASRSWQGEIATGFSRHLSSRLFQWWMTTEHRRVHQLRRANGACKHFIFHYGKHQLHCCPCTPQSNLIMVKNPSHCICHGQHAAASRTCWVVTQLLCFSPYNQGVIHVFGSFFSPGVPGLVEESHHLTGSSSHLMWNLISAFHKEITTWS